MEKILIYNSLSKQKEEFKPIINNELGLYTCGPTVYNYAHVGNLRTYLFEDFLKRTFLFNGYKIKHVMNITDVGHLIGDEDDGKDKLEVEAKKTGKSAKEISEFYLKAFKDDLEKLNIIFPDIWYKATETIQEQIDLIKKLEEKGYTYKISDGIYFDTAKLPEYNKLSHQDLDALKEGARVQKNSEKRNITDFALWKFSPKNEQRQMEWESPWGVGFPGWHIECSAMSLKGLGDQLDIHCGGIDHINIHHTNEIAQSEAATGKKFFNYWLHGAFLSLGGKKMAKSKSNFLILDKAFTEKNINPLVYRFACLQVHYRKQMEYSEELMLNTNNAFKSLLKKISSLGNKKGEINNIYREKFLLAINNDLNMPQALATLQEMLKDDKLSNEDKLAGVEEFDKVLGLDLLSLSKEISDTESVDIPDNVLMLAKKRQEERNNANYEESDRLRKEIEDLGYEIEDFKDGFKLHKK